MKALRRWRVAGAREQVLEHCVTSNGVEASLEYPVSCMHSHLAILHSVEE